MSDLRFNTAAPDAGTLREASFTLEDVEILRQMPAYIRGLGLGNDPNGVAAFIADLADRIAATLPPAPADDAPKATT